MNIAAHQAEQMLLQKWQARGQVRHPRKGEPAQRDRVEGDRITGIDVAVDRAETDDFTRKVEAEDALAAFTIDDARFHRASAYGCDGIEPLALTKDVIAHVKGTDVLDQHVQGGELSNATIAEIKLDIPADRPVSAAIYQLDAIVRRAPSLQLTADGKAGRPAAPAAAKPAREGVPA